MTKLPFLNCSTTVIAPSLLVRTVKTLSYVSSAQLFPHVPESGDPLAYRPIVLSRRRRPGRVGQRAEIGGGECVVVTDQRQERGLVSPDVAVFESGPAAA